MCCGGGASQLDEHMSEQKKTSEPVPGSLSSQSNSCRQWSRMLYPFNSAGFGTMIHARELGAAGKKYGASSQQQASKVLAPLDLRLHLNHNVCMYDGPMRSC